MMKTYAVTLPENAPLTLQAYVDNTLEAFELVGNSGRFYRFTALNAGGGSGPRWFDTDNFSVYLTLRDEFSNYGVSVEPQTLVVDLD